MNNLIERTLDVYIATAAAKNLDGHLNLYAENALVFDMWDEWSLQGLDSLREMIKEWFASLGQNSVKIEAKDIQSTEKQDLVYGAAMLKYSAISPEGQTLRWLQNRMTLVLERRGENWKIIHQHTSGPVDHDSQKVKLQQTII